LGGTAARSVINASRRQPGTATGRSAARTWFAVTDEYTRVCLALEVDRGVPQHNRSGNGSESIASAIRRHCRQAGLELLYIEPAAPWENGYAESFFSRLRDELLNVETFMNLAEARWFVRQRLHEHNEQRPQSSLGYQTPAAFASQGGCRRSSYDRTPAAPCGTSDSPETPKPWHRNPGQAPPRFPIPSEVTSRPWARDIASVSPSTEHRCAAPIRCLPSRLDHPPEAGRPGPTFAAWADPA